ncbi:MAG: multiheme c-type cytochrome, partial [Calditrichia bacterium]
MKNLSQIRRMVVILIPLLILSLTLFTACEKETEKIVEVEKEALITVDSIMVDQTEVSQGETVMLTANITKKQGAGTVTKTWTADGGTLNKTQGDTVMWTAPSDSGVYMISVHATDGENIAIGTRNIGVDMYSPTETPYYVGSSVCANCHGNKNTAWAMTAHADAWASLHTSGHASPSCYPCHSVGYEGPDGNGGFDEVPIEKFQDVQCENCHGAGSEHIQSPSSNLLTLTFDVQNCGKCHEDAHHPYMEQWEESGHSFDPITGAHGAPTRGSCQGCHEGVSAAIRLSDASSAFYGGGGDTRDTLNYHGISGNINSSIEMGLQPITCQTCHDPHSADNPGQLRTSKDITLVNGQVLSENSTAQLCVQCHHARHSGEEQVPTGDAHFGPHPSTQGDVVYGMNGYEEVNPGMTFVSSGHGKIHNACAACHVYMTDFDPIAGTTNVGHTFEPRVEACQDCHGANVSSFEDIQAKKDFDNDGTVEALRAEVTGLMELLAQTMVNADTTAGDTLM